MECQRFETLLSDHIAGRLESTVAQAMSRHEAECVRCGELVRQVRQIQDELAGEPHLTVRLELVEAIMRRTSGLPKRGSFWQDVVVPTLRPFYSQRFAFATLIMFVFISVMVNVMGPEFSAYSRNPSLLMDKADQVSSQIYGGWRRFNDFKSKVAAEIALFREDLFGRLDYHLITLLFREYEAAPPALPEGSPEPAPTGDNESGEEEGSNNE